MACTASAMALPMECIFTAVELPSNSESGLFQPVCDHQHHLARNGSSERGIVLSIFVMQP
ncbi:hypothetical protein IG631_09262 [Alternaria alternata]|nr:hypothetical protein IG631_09262 [Alternaria alternata]